MTIAARIQGATLALAMATMAPAQVWTEVNAGDLPATAELTVGDGGVLSRIDGTLAPNTDVDMFLIQVDDPASFRCSTVGGAGWDTQLWMFGLDGRGISFNDDAAGLQSTLTGQFLAGPQRVLIAISRYSNDAEDVTGNELWLDNPFAVERAPDGPGAANPIDHWDFGAAGPAGNYSICLAGASFAGSETPDAPVVAWAWVDPPAALPATFTPSLAYQYTPSGRPITVTRIFGGYFRVNVPDVNGAGGVVHATAYRGDHTAMIDNWGPSATGASVNILVRDAVGNPVDEAFTVMFRSGGGTTAREAYLWANQPTGHYTPDPSYLWNGTRPSPTVSRGPVGVYTVTLPGLGSVSSPELGHVQVTAYGSTLRRAKVSSWSHGVNDVTVTVRTFDFTGAPADALFTLSYNEVAAPIPGNLGSGGHVWANSPTAAVPYIPSPAYTDSNGTIAPPNGEMVARVGVGIYQVDLPDLMPFGSSIAIATAYGPGSEYATIANWLPLGMGTTVKVETYNAAGAPADARFDLLYLTNGPAGAVATNSVIGGACGSCVAGLAGGPIVLQSLTRPIIGSLWQTRLLNIPAGTISYQVVGLVDPNLPMDLLLGPGWACQVLHASLDLVQVGAGAPPPSWTFTTAIPTSAVLIGANLYQQGAALAPVGAGLLSNGIRGLIGDV